MTWLDPDPHRLGPALWIWCEQPERPDTWTAFRHSFDLDAVPAAATALIAVDSKYWLWVNGTLVVREGGLKRGPTPDDGYADRVDLAPWLRPGRNQLAVLAWYWGHDGASHRSSGKGGLLFALDAGGTRVKTDGSWRALAHPGFDQEGPRAVSATARRLRGDGNFQVQDRGISITLSEWSVRFDARRDLPGWTEPGFADHDWPAALELGTPPAPPWGRLAERPIPFWHDSERQPFVSLEGGTLPCDGPAELRGHLPANLQVLPWLDVDAAAGAEVVIEIERDYKTTTLVTAAGRQTFEVPAWGNGHYVTFHIPAGVRVLDLGWRETGYAAAANRFDSSREDLNILWRKAARSVHLNMRDNWTDCPDRERAPWPGDAANAIEIAACTLTPAAMQLAAKAFREFAAWAGPDGVLWGGVPTGRFRGAFREFPAQNQAFLAVGLPAYVLHSGDLDLLRELWPQIRHYLLDLYQLDDQDLAAHRGPLALAWGPGTQCWGDWGDGQDLRLLDQGWYALTMKQTATLAGWIGADADAAICRARHARLAAAVRTRLWDAEAGAFRQDAAAPDERGNALLVLADVPDAAQCLALTPLLAAQDHASIYMERHVLEALCHLGRTDLALARMSRRYAREIASPYSTLPEGFGAESNHAWGGYPAVMTARHVAGVTPVAPGWRRFRVAPSPAAPAAWALELQTVAGPVRARAETRNAGRDLTVSVPAGTEAEVVPAAPPGWQVTPPATAAAAGPGAWRVGPGEWHFTVFATKNTKIT